MPVLGGAIIGVFGGLVGTTYAHRLSNNQAKITEKKSKLEALITEAYEIDIWLKKQENYYLYGGDEILEQSPIAKIEAIGALYFPELNKEVTQLSAKSMKYKAWLIDGAKLRLASKILLTPQEHLDKMGKIYHPLIQSRDEVINRAKNLSKVLNVF